MSNVFFAERNDRINDIVQYIINKFSMTVQKEFEDCNLWVNKNQNIFLKVYDKHIVVEVENNPKITQMFREMILFANN